MQCYQTKVMVSEIIWATLIEMFYFEQNEIDKVI